MFEYVTRNDGAIEPYFEEYIIRKGNNPCGAKPAKLKLYLPIQKRADKMKITLINDPGLCFITAKAGGHNAEKAASKTVIDYLSEHYPYIVKTSKEFYLSKTSHGGPKACSCVCGVKVNSELRIRDDDNVSCGAVENLTIDKGSYLMLESSVMGDYDRYAELLLSFARDNGMATDGAGGKGKIFAVYDARESFDNPKIRMYLQIKKSGKI